MCSTTLAQKGNKPKGGMKPGKPNQAMRGGGGGNKDKKEQLLAQNLPPLFQALSDAEVILLSRLCQRSVSWMNREELLKPEAADIASVFGDFWVEVSGAEASPAPSMSKTARNARFESTGQLVLTKLNLDQRRALAKVLPEQEAEIKQSLSLRIALVTQISEIRDHKVSSRSSDGEARKILRELSRLEASIAARQARAFSELNDSLSKDQRESLQLICQSPIETKPSRDATQEIDEELRNASQEVRIAFQRLAGNAALWIGKESITSNTKTDFELPLSDDAASDQFLQTYLTALTAAQQKDLLALLAGRVRAETQLANVQQRVQVMLLGLRSNQTFDARQFQDAMEANLETMFLTSQTEASAFEQLMNSLSKAQREHLESTLDIRFPSDKTSAKSGKGKA